MAHNWQKWKSEKEVKENRRLAVPISWKEDPLLGGVFKIFCTWMRLPDKEILTFSIQGVSERTVFPKNWHFYAKFAYFYIISSNVAFTCFWNF